jgi:hypothetical protein
MRKIKIMMMMPLFLAVSLFFAGCGQSVDNDSDDTPTGSVPLPDEFLNGNNVYGIADGITSGASGAAGTRSWLTYNTIQYTVNLSGESLTLHADDPSDDIIYPLVPAGKSLILNAQGKYILPESADTGSPVPIVYVDGALYLTNAGTLALGVGSVPGRIRLRNNGRLIVTTGTELNYSGAATLDSIMGSGNTPALRSSGIEFMRGSTLNFSNGTPTHDFFSIGQTDDNHTDLQDIWDRSSPADVTIDQGKIKSAQIFAFSVSPDRKLTVYNNMGTGLDDIPGIKLGEQSDPIIISEGLIYVDNGGQVGKVLEHLDLEVNGKLDANRIIRPKSIKVGPRGVLINGQATGLDTSLSVVSGGVASLGNLVSNDPDKTVTDVSVEPGALLTIDNGGMLNGTMINYNRGQIGGTLILTGNNKYTVDTAVTGLLEYRHSAGTVSLTDADLTNVELSNGMASIKKNGASLTVNGDLKLSGNSASVLVGGSRAAGYAALQLYDNIWLDGGFTLKPVGGTAAEIGLTRDVIIKTSRPVDTTTNLGLERGALLLAGDGTILFTNGADGTVEGEELDDEGVVYNAAADRFILGSGSLAVTSDVGFGTLGLKGADIVFGETEAEFGMSLRSGQYIISSEDSTSTGFAIGRLSGHASLATGISIGTVPGYDDIDSFILGPGAEIIFGGESDQPRYLLVGAPYALARTDVTPDDPPVSPFEIRGIAENSTATIKIPNFLIVGSLAASPPTANTENSQPLFQTDRYADSASENPKPSYSSGGITVDEDDGSLYVGHTGTWEWGQHPSTDTESGFDGGWTVTSK